MENPSESANHRDLYVPLGQRPEAITLTVRDLLQRTLSGRIRIPEFQRPLRWTSDDVVKLFDSLWRGYPIGSLLFWKRRGAAGTVRIGRLELPVPEVPDAWWVVDGQQRITALAASLLDLDHGRDRRWSVYFDPRLPGFVGEGAATDVTLCPPASALGEMKRLGRWYREGRVDDAAWALIEEAQQRLLDYAVPAYVVETEDQRALRGVFARLNSSGARMRADEVFQALLGSDSAAPDSLDLAALQERCDLDHFGVPARADVLKCVLSMSGQDPSRRLENLSTVDLSRLVSREDAEDGLMRTVEFLQGPCAIPSVRLVPYPVVLFILARWFNLFPETAEAGHEGVLRKLAAWVWRGAIDGTHVRAEVSRMREAVNAIRPGERDASLHRLMRGTPRALGEWVLEPFNGKNARSRIETLALLAHRPSDRDGPLARGALLTGDRFAREVFASASWDGLEEADSRLARSAANRVVLDDLHTGLATELRDWDPVADRQALASHLIDAESFEALRTNDIPGFLRRRAHALKRALIAWVNERLDLDRPMVLERAAYLDGEG